MSAKIIDDASGHECVTIPELARLVRRNRKTVYNWITDGQIGEADELFVVLGRMLIHWPTFRARQFKPRERLRGQLPDYDEEVTNSLLEKDRHGRIRLAFKYYNGETYREPLGVGE